MALNVINRRFEVGAGAGGTNLFASSKGDAGSEGSEVSPPVL